MSTGLTDDLSEDKSWPPIMSSFEKLAGPRESGRWGGVLLFFCADLAYICNTLGLPHVGNLGNCRSLCLTNRTAMPYNNYGPTVE